MMWGKVLTACIAALKADTALTTAMGGTHIYRNRTRTHIQIPGIYWSIVYSTVEENYSPVNIQWDIFADSAAKIDVIEKALYRLMHSDAPIQYTDLLMWSRFQSRFDMHDENEGVVHSAMEFEYTPARENG